METRETLRNSEIETIYPTQLESERVFLVGIKSTTNPQVKQLEFAQRASLRENTGSSEILQTLMGWSNGTILRTWQNTSTQVLERLNAQPGMFADEILGRAGLTGPFSLQVIEYTEETNPIKFNQNVVRPIQQEKAGAKAKINPQTEQTITHNGYPVYRDVVLVRTNQLKHVLLANDAVTAPISIDAVMAGQA